MRIFRDVTLLIFALGGAVAGSQVPTFVQQYEQALGGALHEARLQLGRYETLARDEGASVENFARRLAANADASVAGVGRTIEDQVERKAALEEQAELLAAAAPFVKPWVLVRHHDADLLAGAWEKYHYTLTLDPAFAAAGAVMGLLVNAWIWGMVNLIGRRPRPRPG